MSIKDGWFSESEVLWPGQKFSLEVRNMVLSLWTYCLFFAHTSCYIDSHPHRHALGSCTHVSFELTVLSTNGVFVLGHVSLPASSSYHLDAVLECTAYVCSGREQGMISTEDVNSRR